MWDERDHEAMKEEEYRERESAFLALCTHTRNTTKSRHCSSYAAAAAMPHHHHHHKPVKTLTYYVRTYIGWAYLLL